MLGLTRRPKTDPAAGDTAIDTPAYLRRHSLVSPARERPMLWTSAPPRTPGWFWCRLAGSATFEAIYVAPGDEYATGKLEWSSAAIPTPRDAA